MSSQWPSRPVLGIDMALEEIIKNIKFTFWAHQYQSLRIVNISSFSLQAVK